MSRRLACSQVAVVAMLVLGAPVARAGGKRGNSLKDACVDANTSAQALRLDGKLAAARQQLDTCNDPRCPKIVRSDCALRLAELDRAQPTVVFQVSDAKGAPVTAVHVTLDGRPFADTLDGSELRVDPGTHTITFAVGGAAPIERTIVFKEGEKRREAVVLPPTTAPDAPAPTPSPTQSTSPQPAPAQEVLAPPSSGLGTQRVLGVVGMGLGIAGVAVGATFGFLAKSAKDQQNTDCASPTSCQNHGAALGDHQSAVNDGLVSTVGFIAGGVLLAGGATLFLSGGHSTTNTASLSLAPSVLPGALGATLAGEF